MAYTASPISKLANELLSTVFVLCLPSTPPDVIYMYVPALNAPSPTTAPLLLCNVCHHWRAVAIDLPVLWKSLDTENLSHPELLDLWLSRARQSTLSLRISAPLAPDWSRIGLFWPINPAEEDFLLTTPRHLHLLLPKIPHCRELEMMDWFIPESFPATFPSPIPLESLVVRVRNDSLDAAVWISQLLTHAPRLTRLHWHGPDISAPWYRLTHLSWNVEVADITRLGQTLESLTQLQALRMGLSGISHLAFALRTYDAFHIVPNVTRFSLRGSTNIARILILPKLQHLILEQTESDDSHESRNALQMMLQLSECSLNSIELCDHHFRPDKLTPRFLTGSAAHTLTHILVSSVDFSELLDHLERERPGTLSRTLQLLRPADRAFRVGRVLGLADDSTVHELAVLIKARFPRLQLLQLVEPQTLYSDQADRAVESHPVIMDGASGFVVSRSARLLDEYRDWWNSEDGLEFQTALDTIDLAILKGFDLPRHFHIRYRAHPHDTQNIFANSERVGYKFIYKPQSNFILYHKPLLLANQNEIALPAQVVV
ncbi:hypothetical protein B0H19DRAFT_1377464 [Mycena capillaripes]|nr:hypothetical protein B0H19DRAFT_1377464 [Mycena capillaripes]